MSSVVSSRIVPYPFGGAQLNRIFLPGGKLRSDADEAARKASGEGGRNMPWSGGWERTPEEKKVCDHLEKVQKEVGAKSLTAGEYHPSSRSRPTR